MKPSPTLLSAASLCLALAVALSGCSGSGGKPRIGVALFSVDDGFVSAARRAMEAQAAGKARLSVLDGQNQQAIQNQQIEAMVEDRANAIIVNPVQSSIIQALVFRAKSAGVPLVILSRDPPAVAVQSWDKAFFVGVRTEESDALQVEILGEHWKEHPEADKDGDGTLDYILIRGGSGGSAALDSAANRQRSFEAAGIEAGQIADIDAGWSRVEAQKRVAALLVSIKAGTIEAVICGNDDMALGAIEALKAAGAFKNEASYIPVVGVDGTRLALDAIGEGSLLGTVASDATTQGKAAFDLAYALATGADPTNAGWALTEGKFVLIANRKVTSQNYQAFMD